MANPQDTGLPRPSDVIASEYRLRRLGRLRGHRIAPGEIDIRGWFVFAEDGRRVGRLRDIVVDVQTLTIRFLELELDPHLASSWESRRLMVPIACARVSAQRPHVHLQRVTWRELPHAPRIGARSVGAADECALLTFFMGTTEPAPGPSDEQQMQRSLEEEFWGVRRGRSTARPYLARRDATPHS